MESKKTSGMNCSQYLSRCKAQCCGPAPIPKNKLNILKEFIVRDIVEIIKLRPGHMVAPITESKYCCFLGKDFKCNIYDNRPHVCQIFGKGINRKLQCSWLINGTAELPPEKEKPAKQK